MIHILETANKIVWGAPTLLLIIGVGLFISIYAGAPQLTLFPRALREFFIRSKPKRGTHNGTSSYRALCTALAATVGTGNIAGVAGAITIGGAGAIFWMWVSAFFGMVTKFAEATLAVRYRVRNKNGEWIGGPMYMITNGLKKRWAPLATIYCFFGVVAALGVGNATQVNALLGGIHNAADAIGVTLAENCDLVLCVCLAVLVGVVFVGGARRIGVIAEMLVPFASVLYILLSLGVLVICRENIGNAFLQIFVGAFQPRAVTGGIVGSIFIALRTGSSRGVFTNEAGMGTASIAHAGADVKHPCQQGLMGIIEVFIDTIVICTMTALVILCSGVSVPYGVDIGVQLTLNAFSSVYGQWVNIPLAICLCSFAIATIFGWGFYGLRCAQFLFGDGVWRIFALLQSATVVLGAILGTGTVWLLSETVNGLMAIPNLVALLCLSPELIRLTCEYKYQIDRLSVVGGTNENIHQCKSVRTLPNA